MPNYPDGAMPNVPASPTYKGEKEVCYWCNLPFEPDHLRGTGDRGICLECLAEHYTILGEVQEAEGRPAAPEVRTYILALETLLADTLLNEKEGGR